MGGGLREGQGLPDNIQYYGDCSSTRYSYTDNKNSYWAMFRLSKTTKYRYMHFGLYLVQPAMATFSSLSHATRTCELFPICTSLTWLQAISLILRYFSLKLVLIEYPTDGHKVTLCVRSFHFVAVCQSVCHRTL